MPVSPTISIIIPTHNGAGTLAECLQAIQSGSYGPCEIIVVDDASTDDSAQIATQLGCRVIRQRENIGAARAKNVGARSAVGDILFFTDDDVALARDALTQIASDFEDASLDGVVGLFTSASPFRDFASQQKNLWMLFSYERFATRQHIGLFYTSVAAIRRPVFNELGGFDENYTGASIAEDTEFGQRVWGAGHRIILDPNVRATHYKHYTVWQVLATDFLRSRALTLMRLRKLGQPFFTSVPMFYQLAVPLIYMALAAVSAFLVLGSWYFGVGALVSLIVFYFLFLPWLLYLARNRGILFGLIAAAFQPFDVIVVGLGMFVALIDNLRGVRY